MNDLGEEPGMGEHRAICRLGVFYDGSFFTYAQNYYSTSGSSAGFASPSCIAS